MSLFEEENQIREAMIIIRAIRDKKVSASMSTIEQYPKEVVERAKMRIHNERS